MTRSEIFKQRLQRIAAQSENTNTTLYVGMDEQFPGAAPWASQPFNAASSSVSLPLLAVALLSGALSWIWAQWLQLGLLAEATPLVSTLAVPAFALAGVGLLSAILGLRGWRVFAVQLLGAVLAALLMHNAVQAWPQAFALIFPPDWIAGMQAIAAPLALPGPSASL